jgi:hypothetical protein
MTTVNSLLAQFWTGIGKALLGAFGQVPSHNHLPV